jgi:two-component system alkaline phosphatase synthesis response regulator PhoP
MTEAARILIVEDDPGIQKSLHDALALSGYTVVAVDNGRLALEVVERDLVALIFLDMKMPDMDGWTFAREYRARVSNPAPIVVVTAARDAEKWAAEVDAVAYLAKPFELDDLFRIVDRLLEP